jgi:hypothetical protein
MVSQQSPQNTEQVPTQILQAILDLRRDFQDAMRDFRIDMKEELAILRDAMTHYATQEIAEERHRTFTDWQKEINEERRETKNSAVNDKNRSISAMQAVFLMLATFMLNGGLTLVLWIATRR